MKSKLLGLIRRLMYQNLSKGDYGCATCRASTEDIIKRIEKRKRIVIEFNPDFNICDCFMGYHITDVTDKYTE